MEVRVVVVATSNVVVDRPVPGAVISRCVPRGALSAGARPRKREAATAHAPLAAAVACAAQGLCDKGGGIVLPAPVIAANIPGAVVRELVTAVAFDAGAV